MTYKEYLGYRPFAQLPQKSITFDANMIGYLYVLSSPKLTQEEYIKIKKVLTNEQMMIMQQVISSGFSGVSFRTTPQVINEIIDYARVKRDPEVINFLARICKTRIPRDRSEKIKCAELIVDLMQEYMREDIPLSNNVRAYESAIASEVKKGEENFADARIVAENTILNGCPVVTRNEKHLVAVKKFKRRNNIRSRAILAKNKQFAISHKRQITSKQVRQNLNNEESTTFRISDIPHLIR